MELLRSINWMTLIDNSKNLPGYVILFPKLCFHIQNRTVDKTASRVTKTINIVYFVFRFVMILNAAFIGFVHVANVFVMLIKRCLDKLSSRVLAAYILFCLIKYSDSYSWFIQSIVDQKGGRKSWSAKYMFDVIFG